MYKPEPNMHFKFMAISYKFRDFFSPPKNILKEVGIKQGFYMLDFGCGPGSYIVPAAKMVGESGKIYAMDIHPIAMEMVTNIISKKQLKNVEIIHSDCETGLPDNNIDVVLLYDTFHHLSTPQEVLEELHRILKMDGILSFSDHHMEEDEIISKVTNRGLYRLLSKGKRTYSFSKSE